MSALFLHRLALTHGDAWDWRLRARRATLERTHRSNRINEKCHQGLPELLPRRESSKPSKIRKELAKPAPVAAMGPPTREARPTIRPMHHNIVNSHEPTPINVTLSQEGPAGPWSAFSVQAVRKVRATKNEGKARTA
jgi:hypothetical protein